MTDGPPTLVGLLDDAATEAGVEGERGADGATAWNGAAGPFAILAADGASVDFRLDPTLADAAVRTPDTVTSERGRAWVTFAPREGESGVSPQTLENRQRRLRPLPRSYLS